jgi:Protein of unknown function (DUF2845)
MKRTLGRWCFLTLLLLLPHAGLSAASLDCSGGIISVGDSRADLLAKCGPPDSKESHYEELSSRPDQSVRQKLFVTVEEWTYDFGPSRFTRIVTLTNGKVADIRSGNYGYRKGAGPEQRECTEQAVSVGDSKSDVIAKCGEPTLRDTHEEEFAQRLENGEVRKTIAVVEEWTYNLGPNRFMRILTFRNSRLVDIRTGNYGYELKQEEKKK